MPVFLFVCLFLNLLPQWKTLWQYKGMTYLSQQFFFSLMPVNISRTNAELTRKTYIYIHIQTCIYIYHFYWFSTMHNDSRWNSEIRGRLGPDCVSFLVLYFGFHIQGYSHSCLLFPRVGKLINILLASHRGDRNLDRENCFSSWILRINSTKTTKR